MTTVELFKSISRLWNCFLLSATTDGRDGLEMKLVKTRTVFFCLFVLFCFYFHFIVCFFKVLMTAHTYVSHQKIYYY